MKNRTTYFTKNADETKLLGEKLAKDFQNGGFIAFYGNLGSGKTTFIQGLAKGLGIKRRIISPTFIIMRSYDLKNRNFYHVDIYRLEGKESFANLGLLEIMSDLNNIIALEWSEKIQNFLPKRRTEVKFKSQNGENREIEITKYE